jgi:hypothetical protein
MKTSLKTAALAALAVAAIAGSANATVGVSYTSDDLSLPAGHAMVWDFDGLQAAGYGVSTTGTVSYYSGADGLQSGVAAPPPGDNSIYASVLGGGSLTLTTPAIKLLSVYMGSPDSYNSIRFNFSDNTSALLLGDVLAGGAFDGNQSIGRRMTYTFGGKTVTSVVFGSSQNSFEFDNIATLSAVPEPATWAMMITGFGLAGASLRQRRRQTAAAFA